MIGFLALRCLGYLAPLIPSWLGYRLAGLFGELGYHLMPLARENVAANLRVVLGEAATGERLACAVRGVFRTAAQNYFDLFRVSRLDADDFQRRVRVRGWEHIDAALRGGKGVVVVGAHLGNLDVVANLTVFRGIPCTIPTERLNSQRILDLVTGIRSSRGLNILPLERRGALRDLFEALRNNGIVAIVGDRDLQGRGVPLPFFGTTASLPTGAVTLALRTGAPLLAGRALRVGSGKLDVLITPPLDLPRTGHRQDVVEGTAVVAATLERFIREGVDQWIVFERFWPQQRSATDAASLVLSAEQP